MAKPNNYKAIFFISILFLAYSCKEKTDFADEPIISNLQIVLNTDSTANIVFDFTDGDGDIGFRPEDTTGVFNPKTGEHKFNLVIDYYENENGIWTKPRADVFSARISDLGGSGPIQGSINRRIEKPITYFDPISTNKLFRYEVSLKDRSLNQSNIITSETLVKP